MKNVDWSKWNAKTNNFKKYSHIKSELIYGKPAKNPNLVSIMIITYKRAHGLKEALDSALAQDYKDNYTITVVDDSGFDKETDELMKQYCKNHSNVIYYRNEKNLGQYANWNRACELCSTEWYCLLHDDDILKKNYLKEATKYIQKKNIGLLGVYIDVNDTRDESSKSKESLTRIIFNKIVSLFLTVRRGNGILLSLKDNIKHIYVMNSTFINKSKAMDIGGLDDSYFPSSDFAFSAKMCYYYATGFLPTKLTNKGVGESESMKQSVCNDSIKCSYYQTEAMCKSLGYSKSRQKRKASIAAVISEIGVKGYNNVDYRPIKKELGINNIYNNKIIILLINIYSKLNWGMLLFRSRLSKAKE